MSKTPSTCNIVELIEAESKSTEDIGSVKVNNHLFATNFRTPF